MSEFERWQGRFAVPEYIFGTDPNAFLAAQRERIPREGRALAVADGGGRNGVFLAECGLNVVSLDFAPHAQAKAQALARSRGVTIATELAEVLAWTWPREAFDVVAVIFTQFMGPADRETFFAGIRDTLKPGGLLLLEGYTPKQLAYGTGGPKVVENTYTRELLEASFGSFAALEDQRVRSEDERGRRSHRHVRGNRSRRRKISSVRRDKERRILADKMTRRSPGGARVERSDFSPPPPSAPPGSPRCRGAPARSRA